MLGDLSTVASTRGRDALISAVRAALTQSLCHLVQQPVCDPRTQPFRSMGQLWLHNMIQIFIQI